MLAKSRRVFSTQKDLTLNAREPKCLSPQVSLWDTHFVDKIEFNPDLIDECSKRDSSDEKRRLATESTLATLDHHHLEIWSDGSVKNGLGAGAAILFSDNRPPIVSGRPSGQLSHSYRAELQGISAGLDGVLQLQEDIDNKKLLICTDSQSSINALKTGPISRTSNLLSHIWSQLSRLTQRGLSNITFQFTASHCGIERNEMADKKADKALTRCAAEQPLVPIPLDAMKNEIKLHVKTDWLNQLDKNNAR